MIEKLPTFKDFLNENTKPKGAPDWHDSDAPDAEGRFRDLSPKDLAAWLIKTRKKALKKITGSLNQQIVFNRNKNPDYAKKMERTRREVYKQLGREDLLESFEFVEFFPESIWESSKDQKSTDRSPIDSQKIETALKNKSDETGVPIGILRAVMRRGLAAWKTGHRPGAGQEQWGYARVNSFLVKGEGTWGKADADLAKEVRDGGHDKKLKEDYFSGISKSTADKKRAQMAKQAQMDDDDPNAYKKMPGDTKGKKNLKPSKYTLKYHDLYKS